MNSDDVINGFASIMDVVFQFNDPDPLLITRWYQILALPMDFYQKRPEYLGMGLQRILTDLKTTMTIDENVKPSFFSLGFYLLKVFFLTKKVARLFVPVFVLNFQRLRVYSPFLK